MNKIKPSYLALGIWFLTSLFLNIGLLIYLSITDSFYSFFKLILLTPFFLIFSIPALIVLLISIPIIHNTYVTVKLKFIKLFRNCFIITVVYSVLLGFGISAFDSPTFVVAFFVCFISLSTAVSISILILHKKIKIYFHHHLNSKIMNYNQQETNLYDSSTNEKLPKSNQSNKILIKGLITAALILLLLIPTVFIQNLVKERQDRQLDVVNEVKQGWSSEQTIYGPYIYLPYTVNEKTIEGKDKLINKFVYLLPQQLNVNSHIVPELRNRSIYKVLLYRSSNKFSGQFKLSIPNNLNNATIQWQNAYLCVGVTDNKGFEDKVSIKFNNINYDFLSGLPIKEYDSKMVKNNNDYRDGSSTKFEQIELNGMHTTLNLTASDVDKTINFDMDIKLKGSEQLHFVPLAVNSKFNIHSNWKDPKFDGNTLPNKRDVNENGFSAEWVFNSSNLSFSNVINSLSFNKNNYAFGVSMLQPTDHYAKSMRSVKYAILFIGLTFALFFIIEVMQKKPLHPIQYVLIGFALIIFFTLLLSISEFLLFDNAYIISASATIILISTYVKMHFGSFKAMLLFGIFLSFLYAFIFVLISLEDAALLVGSIGLFIILTLIMFGSKRINWYGSN